MNAISYTRISDALNFYQDRGYMHVEVPWVVPRWAILPTCPHPENVPDISPGRVLVGSAEQSFIYLDSTGQLSKGKFVTCTPCFRPGDSDGALHQSEFMKVELYVNDYVTDIGFKRVVLDAFAFFESQLGSNDLLCRGEPGTGSLPSVDLNVNDIEVGSYGIRHHESLEWVYGTGLAEPRFSMARRRLPSPKVQHERP